MRLVKFDFKYQDEHWTTAMTKGPKSKIPTKFSFMNSTETESPGEGQ